MSHIIIRCDASASIGNGHAMRCRTLARELQRRGEEVTFLCRRQSGDQISLLEREFSVLALPEQELVPCESLEGKRLYAAWLGCSQGEDALQCLDALARAGIKHANWLVVDHYGLSAAWEEQLLSTLMSAGSQTKLLVIDDLNDRLHNADVLLDQNFIGDNTWQRYQKLTPPNCRKLLGPHYALLGQEYCKLHPQIVPRTELRRVLVYFGGVDSEGLTSRALEALMDPLLANLVVDVVLELKSPQHKFVSEMVSRRPHTNLYGFLPSLSNLIAAADLAIGAGGATTWERACLGLPSLVVASADNQLPFVHALSEADHVELLGDASSVTAGKIRTALLARMNKPYTGSAGSVLTDGFGASRLATAMLGAESPITLRQATIIDEALLLRWANDSEVRSNSFSPDPIDAADHHRWFHEGLMNTNRLQLIAVAGENCPIGQIRFDRQPRRTEDGVSEAVIDLSLDRSARGHGLAIELIHLGLEAMKECWDSTTEVVAEVLTNNTSSNSCFKRAGFTLECVSDIHALSQPVNRWRLII